ncbi:MAG: Uma2 family endonuclease [Chloroflexaceae bacterium]|jgi:Uma2 family endonuclease|nr:Uma2 family endonuclease [Chloroflexaceae bacterium]
MTTETLAPPEFTTRSLDATWNYARWAQLPENGNRYEVIDGVLYMTTAPSYFHQWTVSRIVRLLQTQIEDTGIGFVSFAPIGLLMPGCDPVQPDIVVVRSEDTGIIYDRHINGVPALIVEVLSPSNAEKDTEIKRAAYARAGVPEYWLVRPAERDVLVLSQPDPNAGLYLQTTPIPPASELVSPTLPFRAVIAAFFAGSPDETV